MNKPVAQRYRPRENENRPRASLSSWFLLQESLAKGIGIALLTLDEKSEPIGRAENNNSICEAMRASAPHAELCALECGRAADMEAAVDGIAQFQCHAGLHCFTLPLAIQGRRATVLGGRAFTSSVEYKQFLRKYGDLETVRTGECLRNIKFLDKRELNQAAQLVASSASASAAEASPTAPAPEPPRETTRVPKRLLDAHLEIIRLTDQLESRDRTAAQLSSFLSDVALAHAPESVYDSMLTRLGDIMSAERISLMILNDEAEELSLEAAVGFKPNLSTPVRVKLGEEIAGAVMASGSAMMVRDVDSDSRVSRKWKSGYTARSFISYPITLGPRKVGVINLTGRVDGTAYDRDDLSLIEMMAPHIALLIDRTEWHKKAEQFQRMSLTDQLTGLPNRRYLEERLFEEVERSKRHGTPLTFMIIDVDRFKTFNDHYGHTNADSVLARTAQALRKCVRAIDMPARFAGDEFCIILPETEMSDAMFIAERLRKEVGKTEYLTDQGQQMRGVTISIGVSSFAVSRQSPLAIIETADRALYQAKTNGRNCVVMFEDHASVDPPGSERVE